MSLVIHDVQLDGTSVTIVCEGATITSVEPSNGDRPVHDSVDATGYDDEVIDGSGFAVLSGLVNAHTHAAMTLFRSWAGDLQLQEWLDHHIWPAERHLTAEDVYWGTRLAAIEMLRSGTTHFFDMYWHPAAVARAAQDAGIRASVGAPLIDQANAAGLQALRDTAQRSVTEIASDFGDLITPTVTPHAIYTVSEESLRWVADFAAERSIAVHLHFCETIREVDEWNATHDDRPTPYLDRLGLLGERTLLAHGCVMEPADYELVAERGATIATNPSSNMKLASGKLFPTATALAAGVRLGLGTDGPASNNSLDLLSEVKLFALGAKHESYDPTTLPASDALAVAQGRRSPLFGHNEIEPGAPADLILIDLSAPEMNPGELEPNLVYSASGSVVDTTIVAGRVRMRARRIDGEDEVLAEVNRRATRLCVRE